MTLLYYKIPIWFQRSGRWVKIFHGEDQLVRVVEVQTQFGRYRRPVTKIALILPNEDGKLN